MMIMCSVCLGWQRKPAAFPLGKRRRKFSGYSGGGEIQAVAGSDALFAFSSGESGQNVCCDHHGLGGIGSLAEHIDQFSFVVCHGEVLLYRLVFFIVIYLRKYINRRSTHIYPNIFDHCLYTRWRNYYCIIYGTTFVIGGVRP